MAAGLASRAPTLSAGVLTADLTRLGAELEHLRGKAAEVASWGIDVIVSGSAIFDRVDPAANLDLLTRQLLLTTQEVPDGKR